MNIRPTDAAWLAGFIDGEGCFQIVRADRQGYESYAPQIAATGVDLAVIQRCKDIAGGSVYGPVGRGDARWKPAYRWTIKGRRLDPLLAAIEPFIVGKREQMRLIQLLRSETTVGAKSGEFGRQAATAHARDRRRLMKLAMNALNHRGATQPSPEQAAALAAVRSWS